MERWVEGTRAQQMKLSASPWNFTKIRKRFSKQFLWISFAFLTGMTFVGYFVPIRDLVADIINLEIAGWSLFWVFFYGFATYGNAGFMREQVCKYMCPYARFQSAMFDKDTLIVAYDSKRGEPRERGKRRKEDITDQRGDCIDCGICVQVCPTGIDIRDGLQYECIACAACIDACDEVMDRVGLPRGLIEYTSENREANPKVTIKQTLFRPRVLIYATLLTLVVVGFLTALLNRSSFQVDILRDRNALYRWSSEHQIENSYRIKVMNKSQIEQQYSVSLQGLTSAVVAWAKSDDQGNSLPVAAGEIGDYNVTVTLPDDANHLRSQSIELVFAEVNGQKPESEVEETKFWGPAQPPRSGR
jgi:cytochrome c oxidase accessory protein FixG